MKRKQYHLFAGVRWEWGSGMAFYFNVSRCGQCFGSHAYYRTTFVGIAKARQCKKCLRAKP